MGLDEFLIPQASSPTEHARPIGDLDGLLVALPIDSEAQAESMTPADAVPLATLQFDPPPQAQGHGSTTPSRASEPGTTLASGVVIELPLAEEQARNPNADRPKWDQLVGPSPRSEQPFSAPADVVENLRAFFTTTEDSFPSPLREIERIENEFISTAPVMEFGQASESPTSPRPAVPSVWSGDSSALPVELPFRWEDGSSTPPRFEGITDGARDGANLEDHLEQIEERLSRVTDRLERAVERVASPSLPLGSRPRPFRGRIDG